MIEKPLLKISNLTKTLDGKKVLAGVDLELEKGDLALLAGRNGCGKSLLARCCLGLEKADSGRILLEGRPIFDRLRQTRQEIGLLFQDSDHQIVGATVEQEVAFGLENLAVKRAEITRRVEQILAALELERFKERAPYTLSGGEKRRLALAGVLVVEPKIVILDEPFNNLDFPGVQQLLKKLLAVHAGGITLLVICHDLDKILAHANRLFFMEEGRIVAEGEARMIYEQAERFGVKKPGGAFKETTWLR